MQKKALHTPFSYTLFHEKDIAFVSIKFFKSLIAFATLISKS
jgi:hypothetical protein